MVTIELDIEKERPSFFFRSATDEMSFPLILTAKIFHNSSYQVFDVDTSEKRIEIHPSADRSVYCVSKGNIEKEELTTIFPKEFKLEDNEIFISGTTVFAERKGIIDEL